MKCVCAIYSFAFTCVYSVGLNDIHVRYIYICLYIHVVCRTQVHSYLVGALVGSSVGASSSAVGM